MLLCLVKPYGIMCIKTNKRFIYHEDLDQPQENTRLEVGLGRGWGKVGGRGWIRVRKRDLPLFLTLIITQTLSTPNLGQGLPLNKTVD